MNINVREGGKVSDLIEVLQNVKQNKPVGWLEHYDPADNTVDIRIRLQLTQKEYSDVFGENEQL